MAKDVRKPAAKSNPKAAPMKAKPKVKAVAARPAHKSSAPLKVKAAAKTAPAAKVKVQVKPSAKLPIKAKQKAAVPAKTATKKSKPAKAPGHKSQAGAKLISAPKPKSGKVDSSITAPRKVEATVAKQPEKNGAASSAASATASAASTSKPSAGKAMSKKAGVDIATMKLPDGYRPSDDEPFMGSLQRAYFRHKLQKWKDDIIKETMETLQVLQDDTLQHPDLADRATHETDRALELRARDRQRKLISKIEAAIRRVDDGTYGYCEETGEPISLKRLDARPVATLSLEAQERHERRERVYRDE
jgi:DnaK suppressor protein